VATTEDLASLAREIGGDKVAVTGLAKGYQDPHHVDPKPSFIIAAMAPTCSSPWVASSKSAGCRRSSRSSRNAKIQPARNGYLDASLT
jgi:zinc/manganese transport system substrate-binding protein